MGDRYVLEITCPKCGFHDNECYYAPTCGFVDWNCGKCGYVVDLEKYTGISYEDASNAKELSELINKQIENMEKNNNV